MGYHYELPAEAAKPFVPGSMAFAKKKAKELRQQVPDAKLSECQRAIAQALGWKDWFSLEQAVAAPDRVPSAGDEEAGEEESSRRWAQQFRAFSGDLGVLPSDAEFLVAKLGLTCTVATAKRREDAVGPWGAFQGEVTELAPGISFGHCAKFSCFRLSPERVAAMPGVLAGPTLPSGWVMADDYAWRVILSFPEVFPADEVKSAWKALGETEPFLYELLRNEPPVGAYTCGTLLDARMRAVANPTEWFAVSVFHGWYFTESMPNGSNDDKCVVSAIRGKELVRLIDAKGCWSDEQWEQAGLQWFGLSTNALKDRATEPGEVAVLPITGLMGWRSEAVATRPVKSQAFSTLEMGFVSSAGFVATVECVRAGIEELIV